MNSLLIHGSIITAKFDFLIKDVYILLWSKACLKMANPKIAELFEKAGAALDRWKREDKIIDNNIVTGCYLSPDEHPSEKSNRMLADIVRFISILPDIELFTYTPSGKHRMSVYYGIDLPFYSPKTFRVRYKKYMRASEEYYLTSDYFMIIIIKYQLPNDESWYYKFLVHGSAGMPQRCIPLASTVISNWDSPLGRHIYEILQNIHATAHEFMIGW